MIKFVATVNDEVGKKFKEYCAALNKSPYDVLVTVIYKAVQMERKAQSAPVKVQPGRVDAVKGAIAAGRVPAQKTCERCGRPHGDCAHTSPDE